MAEVVLHSKLRGLEEELRTEREVRFKHDKEYVNLQVDVHDLDFQLQEALLQRDREAELNRKLRFELDDLKSKYLSLFNETEESSFTFKRRNQEVVGELTAHVEALTKSKLKYEKDNKTFLLEIESLRSENDSLSRSKAQAVALYHELESKEIEYIQRIDEAIRQLTEANEAKNRLSKENGEYLVKIEKLTFELTQINVTLKRYSQELDDARLQLENEILFRASVENKLKTALYDLSNANAQIELAREERDEFQKIVIKIQEEIRVLREQYNKDLEAKNEELEDVKRRLNAKYLEIQDQLSDAIAKLSASEKLKLKLQLEVENLTAELDRTRKRLDESLRHEKQLEIDIESYRNKLSSTTAELEASLQANRNLQIEITKFKNLSEQLSEQLEVALREKRRLAEDLNVTQNQLTDSQSRLIDLEKRAKSIEAERQSLQAQLEDVRDQLQLEISKYQSLVAQFDSYKAHTDKRLLDKEEEIDELRIAHRRQIEQMQENIELLEARYKSEIISIRKKFQAELDDIRTKYELAKRAVAEAESNYKKLQISYKEISDKLIEEQHAHDVDREALVAAEKRNQTLRGEVEELKTLLERSDKSRKLLEIELHDSETKYADLLLQFNRALAERKKFEADYIEVNDALHELKIELKSSEERARVASAAVVKKDEEIRHERELALEIDAARKVLEQQLREIQIRIEESEEYARKEARRVAAKYEGRLAQLEQDLDLEKNRSADYLKEVRRLEKRSKELTSQVDEEQHRVLTLTDSNDKLQEKLRKYRGQIEGAEGQVAINLSRCRRLQRELEDAEERADTMTKTFLRSTSVSKVIDGTEGESSAIEEYTTAVQTSSSSNRYNTPSYLRSSYLYSKASNIDDYGTTAYGTSYSRASSVGAWRPRFTTADLDGEDVPVRSGTNRYSAHYTASSSVSQYQPSNYQSDYLRARERSKSRVSNKLRRAVRGLSV